MLVLRSPDHVARIADPGVRRLVELRFSQVCDGEPHDPDRHGFMIVVEPGDGVATLEAESGCPILHDIFGEVRFAVPYTYIQFIFPAIVALNIMYTSVQSAVSVIWDREFGFLREVLVSPLPRWAALLGKILGGTTIAVLHGSLYYSAGLSRHDDDM